MRKIKFIILTLLITMASYKFSFAQNTGVGVGVILGSPTGLNAKFWTSKVNAFEFAIGWTNTGEWERYGNAWYFNGGPTFLHIHGDYLWHNYDVIKSQERFPIYYGVGFHYDGGNNFSSAFGVRGVLGVDWMPRTVPLDVFVEIAPVLYLTPGAGFGIDAGVGGRFFFH
ncbi:MAG: hypothetical protein ACP5US_11005 [Candidatus Kryptoniota bacterium]